MSDSIDLELANQLKTNGIVFLSIVMSIGIIGNINAILVYSFFYGKTNHRHFILWLATVDLLACCITMPMAILRYENPSMFATDTTCKLRMFFDTFLGGYSMALLDIIAADRYRKMSSPFKKQLSFRGGQIACGATCLVFLMISLFQPNLVIYYAKTVEMPSSEQNGKSCSTRLDIYHTIYVVIEGIIVVLLFFLCVILYTLVLWNLLRHGKTRSTTSKRKSFFQYFVRFCQSSRRSDETAENATTMYSTETQNTEGDIHKMVDRNQRMLANQNDNKHLQTSSFPRMESNQTSSTDFVNTRKTQKRAIEDESCTDIGKSDDETIDTTGTELSVSVDDIIGIELSNPANYSQEKVKKPGKGNKKSIKLQQSDKNSHMKKGRRVTIMFMTVSFGACAVYLPTIVLNILIALNYGDMLIGSLRGWYGVMTYFYLLNHAINPIVYGFVDTRFREKCKEMYSKLRFRNKQN